MSDSVIDPETIAALKVLRGDHKKDANRVDKDFSSGLVKQGVDALAVQQDSSSTQTAELIKAVREQTAILQKLTDLLEMKQKTTDVVVNEEKDIKSVASTADETELETVTESKDSDPETATIAATAVEGAVEEKKDEEEAVEETTNPVVAEKAVKKAVVKKAMNGETEEKEEEDEAVEETAKPVVAETTADETELEAVTETEDSGDEPATIVSAAVEGEEEAVEQTTNPVVAEKAVKKEVVEKAVKKEVAVTEREVSALPSAVYGPWQFVESDEATKRRSGTKKTKKGDALFGNISGGDQLIGESFGQQWDRMRDSVNQYGKLQPPRWSAKAKKSVRSFLPKLAIADKTTIALKSGVYYLTVKYEEKPSPSSPVEAGIVLGEIGFDNTGSVLSSGAKWSKIIGGEKLKEGRSKPKWYSSKVSGAWKNGDVLRFKIDTNTNTVVYTLTAIEDKEAKAGWKFDNVLAFTNNPTYPKDLRVFAYCGGKGQNFSSSMVKLTVVDESMAAAATTVMGSNSSSTTDTEPELEPVADKAEPETETPLNIIADTDEIDPVFASDNAEE